MLKIYRLGFVAVIFVALTSIALQSNIDLPALIARYSGEAFRSMDNLVEHAIWGWGLALFIWCLTLAMRRVEKYRDNFDNSVKVLYVMLFAPPVLSLIAQIILLAIIYGLIGPIAGEKVFLGTFAVLVIIIGNYGVSVRKAWFTGLPLPWIMASDRIWQKTHRCLGYLFMLTGVITLLSLLIWPTKVVAIGMMVGFVASLTVSIIYSWILARRDPHRIDRSTV